MSSARPLNQGWRGRLDTRQRASSVAAWLVGVVVLSAALAVLIDALGNVQRLTTGVLAITIAVVVAVLGRDDVTRPHVLLPMIWFGAVGLAQIAVINYQTPWSTNMVLVAILAPVAFAAGSFLAGGQVARPKRPPPLGVLDSQRLRVLSLVLLAMGLFGLWLKVGILGSVPILSESIDTLRSAGGIRIPPYVTYLTDCLALAAWARMLRWGLHPGRPRVEDVLVIGIALAGVAASASRNTLLITLVVPLIFVYLAGATRTITPARSLAIATLASVVVLILSGLFFLRTAQHRDSSFESYFYRGVVAQTVVPLRPLLPVQVGLVAPFETLNRVTKRTHLVGSSPDGLYSLPGIPQPVSLWGPRADFYGLTGKLSSPYYFNVATFAGPLYADGGLELVVAAALVLGLMVGAARAWLLLRPTVARLAVMAYLTYFVGFLLYENFAAFYTTSMVWDVLVIAGGLAWCSKAAGASASEEQKGLGAA